MALGARIFDLFRDFAGSQGGNFLTRMFGAQQQRQQNQQVQQQQGALGGIGLGVAGLPGVPGIPSFQPQPGMDLGALPGQAQDLAGRLSGQSNRDFNAIQRGLAGQFNPLLGRLGGLPGQFAGQNQNILNTFGGQAARTQANFQQGAADINRRFDDRLGQAFGILEGRGAQAGEDISTRFRESLGESQAGLRARGFGGTQRANIAQGSARGESAEQRRLQEQLRGERLGVFTDLSGQAVQARQQLLNTGTGLQAGFAGQQLGAAQGGQQFLGGLNLGTIGQQAGIGQFMQGAVQQSRQQNLSNQFQLGQFPIGVQQQGIGQALNFLQPLDVRPPQQLQF